MAACPLPNQGCFPQACPPPNQGCVTCVYGRFTSTVCGPVESGDLIPFNITDASLAVVLLPDGRVQIQVPGTFQIIYSVNGAAMCGCPHGITAALYSNDTLIPNTGFMDQGATIVTLGAGTILSLRALERGQLHQVAGVSATLTINRIC